MSFDQAFQATVGNEGDFSNDPRDSGGATRYGITERVARAHGYTGDMRDLPFDFARQIYREQYWNLLRLDGIAVLSADLANELFDTAVNCSQVFAAKSLQESLNVLNRGALDYPDMAVDGLLGAVTLATLRAYLGKRGEEGVEVLLKALNVLQGARYIHLAEEKPRNENFVYGWLRARVEVS